MANAALQNLFTLFKAGRHAEMAAQARALLIEHPQDGALWKVLSVAQQMLGEAALPALDRAVALLRPPRGEAVLTAALAVGLTCECRAGGAGQSGRAATARGTACTGCGGLPSGAGQRAGVRAGACR